MTSSLYAKDTPLLRDGKRYAGPHPIRWWYNRYIPKLDKHALYHTFWDRKWHEDIVYMTTLHVVNNFTPAPKGGEHDK